MDREKVLQGVPNLKRTTSVPRLNLLIVSQPNPQLVRHSLLRQAVGLSGFLQIAPHSWHLAFFAPAAYPGGLVKMELGGKSRVKAG